MSLSRKTRQRYSIALLGAALCLPGAAGCLLGYETAGAHTNGPDANRTDGALPHAGDDADGDGWPDAVEVACRTDPLDPQDVPLDSDGDGVCDPLDTCPAGDDALDTNGNGIADACDDRLLWLDASASTGLSASGCGSPFLQAYSTVGCWRDMSGYGNHLAPESEAPSVEVQAQSAPTVRFRGTELMRGSLGGFSGGDPPITTFSVIFPEADPPAERALIFQIGESDACAKSIGVAFGPGDFRYYSYCGNRLDFAPLTITADPLVVTTWHEPGLYSQANTSVMAWGPGVEPDGAALTGVGSPTEPPNLEPDASIYLGRQPPGFNPYDGSIAEIMIFFRVLDSTERAYVVSYLRSKWGL